MFLQRRILMSRVAFDRHRFLSLWGACAFFDSMLCRPVCSADVFGCSHQASREGSNQSRLPLVLAYWRRCQSTWNTGIESVKFICILSSGLISRRDS